MGVGTACKASDEHLGRGAQAGNFLRVIQTRILLVTCVEMVGL